MGDHFNENGNNNLVHIFIETNIKNVDHNLVENSTSMCTQHN